MTNTTKLFQCDCYAEGITIEHDDDDDLFFINVWFRGLRSLTLLDKLKYCWSVFFRDVHADEVIFDRKTMEEFRDEITTLLEKKNEDRNILR